MFAPITSKYGIKIVYKVDEEDFLSPLVNPGIPAGPPRGSNVKAIRHRVLARYPSLLQKTLKKYPKNVIKNYLNAIYFAGEIDEDGFKYAGSYDPFRRIVYLVNNGQQNDGDAISTFHHEFSSLLLARYSFLINSWVQHNPEGFQYMTQRYDNYEDRKKARDKITDYFQYGIITTSTNIPP
jgi:hypothetical protein